MKTGTLVLLFVCAALGVTGIATALGDRKTLVPPPEARVEAFLRELQTGRSQLALKYLNGELRPHAPAPYLQHAFRELEATIGGVENVDAETLASDRHSAKARGVLSPSAAAGCRSTSA